MTSKRILITGAGGFVGKYLIQALSKNPSADIYANVYSATNNLAGTLPGGHILPADLTDYAATNELIKSLKPDIIYHLASLSVVQDSAEKGKVVLTNNLGLQYNLLEAMKIYTPHARLVTISTGNVYGNADKEHIPMNEETPLRPLNPYAVSKLTQEFLSLQYYLSYGLDVVILRPFNHTGPGQTTDFIVPLLASQFAKIMKEGTEGEISLGNIDNQRDFTDVRDMVQAYIMAGELGKTGEVYNIGSGIGVSVRQIVEEMESITGLKVQIVTDPSRVRSSDVPVLICDSTKFRTLTGWSPDVPLRDTLESVLAYYTNKVI